jgi:hypothetical protein
MIHNSSAQVDGRAKQFRAGIEEGKKAIGHDLRRLFFVTFSRSTPFIPVELKNKQTDIS